jgi:hypothetical protein
MRGLVRVADQQRRQPAHRRVAVAQLPQKVVEGLKQRLGGRKRLVPDEELRAQNCIVIVVAMSGIAATMLSGGTTVRRRFGMPIEDRAAATRAGAGGTTIDGIDVLSKRAELLQQQVRNKRLAATTTRWRRQGTRSTAATQTRKSATTRPTGSYLSDPACLATPTVVRARRLMRKHKHSDRTQHTNTHFILAESGTASVLVTSSSSSSMHRNCCDARRRGQQPRRRRHRRARNRNSMTLSLVSISSSADHEASLATNRFLVFTLRP